MTENPFESLKSIEVTAEELFTVSQQQQTGQRANIGSIDKNMAAYLRVTQMSDLLVKGLLDDHIKNKRAGGAQGEVSVVVWQAAADCPLTFAGGIPRFDSETFLKRVAYHVEQQNNKKKSSTTSVRH